MTDREDLIRAVKELAVVRGRVALASGKKTDYYVDMHRMTLDRVASPLAGRVVSELVADLDFDAVEGLALGTDPVATAMLHARAAAGDRPGAFVVRKEAKSHSLQRRIEGIDVVGRRVFVVGDTSTTGGSALTAVETVRRMGDEVVTVAMVMDRTAEAAKRVAEAGLEYRCTTGLGELGLWPVPPMAS